MAAKEGLFASERDLESEVVGVKSNLQSLDAKMELRFSELKRLIEDNTNSEKTPNGGGEHSARIDHKSLLVS